MKAKQQSRIRTVSIILAGTWAVFTLTLVGWWIYFGMQQVERLIALQHEDVTLVKYQKMLMYEGMAMIVSLLLGAGALFYYIIREYRERQRLKTFFAAFTHEIKTPLASARLKSEILKEKIQDPSKMDLVEKILADIGRLSVQLENSLFLADNRSSETFLEKISICNALESLRNLWPQIKVECIQDANVLADRRMIDVILANVLQNAFIHGKAKTVTVNASETERSCSIRIEDDGKGFQGDAAQLGKLFGRTYSGSGSGMGLYLITTLVRRLGGKVAFAGASPGFVVTIELPKGA